MMRALKLNRADITPMCVLFHLVDYPLGCLVWTELDRPNKLDLTDDST